MSLKKQNIKAHLYPYTHNKKDYKISNRIYHHSRLNSISGLEIAFVKTTEAGNDASERSVYYDEIISLSMSWVVHIANL